MAGVGGPPCRSFHRFLALLISDPCIRYGQSMLNQLGVSWYYTWSAKPLSGVSMTTFVPMIKKANDVNTTIKGYSTILGFNEPDNDNEANTTVAQAASLWPLVVSKAPSIGSPAMAGNPTTNGSWLRNFTATTPSPKFDFVTFHWYKGCDAAKFISDVKAVIATFGKAVWITEFAPQTAASSAASPTKYTQAQVDSFIFTVVRWMQNEPKVARFAWHDPKVVNSTCSLYDGKGGLSATGRTYAAAI